MITEPDQAEAIIESGQADMVALARAMLYDPRWPWHCAIGFLKRQNWARFVFVGWSALSIIYTFAVVAISAWILIPSLALPVATAIIVFLPDANRYFSGKGDTAATTAEG